MSKKKTKLKSFVVSAAINFAAGVAGVWLFWPRIHALSLDFFFGDLSFGKVC